MKEKYGLLSESEIEGYVSDIYLSSDGNVVSFLDGEFVDKIVILNKEGRPSWEYEINNMTYGLWHQLINFFRYHQIILSWQQ